MWCFPSLEPGWSSLEVLISFSLLREMNLTQTGIAFIINESPCYESQKRHVLAMDRIQEEVQAKLYHS